MPRRQPKLIGEPSRDPSGLAKSNLESSAIECRLVDDNMVRLHWGIVNVLGGVKLQVKSEDAEVALELLEQPVLEQPDEDNP